MYESQNNVGVLLPASGFSMNGIMLCVILCLASFLLTFCYLEQLFIHFHCRIIFYCKSTASCVSSIWGSFQFGLVTDDTAKDFLLGLSPVLCPEPQFLLLLNAVIVHAQGWWRGGVFGSGGSLELVTYKL